MGEIRALAEKATRGAGLDWSMAEEAGFAVRWLETYGAPGCQALSSYLSDSVSSTATATLTQPTRFQCPLRVGTQLLDYNTPHPIKLGAVHYPILLVPFIAAYAHEPRELLWPGVDILVLQKGLYTSATEQAMLQAQAVCTSSNSDKKLPSITTLTRVMPNRQAAISQLQSLSLKTYAPATQASRDKGAGSGLNDND